MLRPRLHLALIATLAAAVPIGVALAAKPAASPPPTTPGLHAPLGDDTTLRGQLGDAVRDSLVAQHSRLARRHAELTGRRKPLAAPRSVRALRRETARLRQDVRDLDIPIPAVLRRVAECESHGDPRAIGGGGAFRGRYQFMVSTWRSVGGRGDPARAPAEEQDRRAAILMARSGSSPWPVCGS